MPRTLTDIPDRLFVKLRYVTNTNWTVASGVGLTPCMTLHSSLYNPEGGLLAGHQPYWYDQWTPGIYRKYRVYGIKYHITVMNPGLNQTWYVGVQPQSDLVDETVLSTLMEHKEAKVKTGGAVGSNTQRVVLKGFMSVAKTLGLTRTEVKNEEWFAADYNADPIKQAYLKIYMNHTYGDAWTFDAIVRCTYYAELFQRNSPAAS